MNQLIEITGQNDKVLIMLHLNCSDGTLLNRQIKCSCSFSCLITAILFSSCPFLRLRRGLTYMFHSLLSDSLSCCQKTEYSMQCLVAASSMHYIIIYVECCLLSWERVDGWGLFMYEYAHVHCKQVYEQNRMSSIALWRPIAIYTCMQQEKRRFLGKQWSFLRIPVVPSLHRVSWLLTNVPLQSPSRYAWSASMTKCGGGPK